MKVNIISHLTCGAMGLALVVAGTGCSHNPPAPTPVAIQQQTQQNIQQIQNDPNIPADTKASLIAHFQNPGGPPPMAQRRPQ